MSRRTGALLGVSAVAAAVGVGHVVAGVVAPASSPLVAVGDAVVRLAPRGLVAFATSTLGAADKPALLAGTAVVLAVLAALAGAASRRHPAPFVAAATALGGLGMLAVLTAPAASPYGLLAPVAALVTAVAVFRWLSGWARGAGGTSGRAVGRRVVLGAGVVGLGAVAAGAAGQLLARRGADARAEVTRLLAAARVVEPAPPVPPGADFAELGTPPFVTPNADFYRIDTALRVPVPDVAAWSLRVHGLVDRELTLRLPDLLERPLTQRLVTMTCVSNEVGGHYVSTAAFTGVPLREVLLEAGVRPGADQLLSTSTDGWTCGTPVDVVLDPGRGALLAVGMNGEALPAEHGFPVRMVVPGLYGYVSGTKWLADLELTTFGARRAYWLRRGWAERAPVKTQSRIDSPRAFSVLGAGPVVLAGVAWAQHTGIDRVEVRADDGPWRDAELAVEVNLDTWRMWRAELDLGPGRHVLQCRATDRTGTVQPEQRSEPVPDGATGWASVAVLVT